MSTDSNHALGDAPRMRDCRVSTVRRTGCQRGTACGLWVQPDLQSLVMTDSDVSEELLAADRLAPERRDAAQSTLDGMHHVALQRAKGPKHDEAAKRFVIRWLPFTIARSLQRSALALLASALACSLTPAQRSQNTHRMRVAFNQQRPQHRRHPHHPHPQPTQQPTSPAPPTTTHTGRFVRRGIRRGDACLRPNALQRMLLAQLHRPKHQCISWGRAERMKGDEAGKRHGMVKKYAKNTQAREAREAMAGRWGAHVESGAEVSKLRVEHVQLLCASACGSQTQIAQQHRSRVRPCAVT